MIDCFVFFCIVVDMVNFYLYSPDSPVLWLRIDPDFNILRVIHFEQPDWMWQYMLRFERCIIAQLDVSFQFILN